MNEYFVMASLIGAFFIGVLTYRQGFKDGLSVNKGKCIETIKNPVVEAIKHVQEVKETKEQKQKDDEYLENLNDWLSYDGSFKRGE